MDKKKGRKSEGCYRLDINSAIIMIIKTLMDLFRYLFDNQFTRRET
jgi:hypothetical protein